jgi:hypothetical protein
MPSLDLVIYKMGGNKEQYDPRLTDVCEMVCAAVVLQ